MLQKLAWTGPTLTLGTRLQGRHAGTPVMVSGAAALQHKQLHGTSGAGKSKLAVALLAQFINQGIGGCLLDPHGDAIDDLLGFLLDTGFYADPRAYQRVLYLPWNRQDRFVPYNVLADPSEPHQVARNVMEAMRRQWSGLDSGRTPQLENLILYGSFVLIQNGLPLTALGRLFADASFRAQVLQRVTDAEVVSYFRDQYDTLGRRAGMLTESTARRLSLLGFVPALRNSLGQATNLVQWRRLIDAGVMVLLDLRNLDQETTRLLGALLTVGIEQAALSRADLPEEQRRPFMAVIDEAAQFISGSAVTLEQTLAQARKYAVCLVLAFQHWSQVGHKLQGALQSAQLIAFRAGREDSDVAAQLLADFNPYAVKTLTRSGAPLYFSQAEQRQQFVHELQALAPGQAFMHLGEGARAETIKLQTVGVPEPHCSRVQLEAIKERYAQLYLAPRTQIERDDAGGGGTVWDRPTGSASQVKLAGQRPPAAHAPSDAADAAHASRGPAVRRRVPLRDEAHLLDADQTDE